MTSFYQSRWEDDWVHFSRFYGCLSGKTGVLVSLLSWRGEGTEKDAQQVWRAEASGALSLLEPLPLS